MTDSVDAVQRAQRRPSSRSDDRVSELDRQIISRLQADGRRPYTQIAAELGMSEAAVRARANRLMADGILQIVGVADPLRFGYELMALVAVTCHPARLPALADEVAAFAEVLRVVVTTGTFDLLIEIVCEDREALLAFISQRLGALEGILSTETFVYLRVAKQEYQWSAPG